MFDPFAQSPYTGLGTPSGNFPANLTLREAWPEMSSTLLNPFLGVTGQGEPVAIDQENDSPHVMISAGTGGGKSTIARGILAQHLAHGGQGVVLDYKQISQRWVTPLAPVARVATSVPEVGTALFNLGKELHRRNAVIRAHQGPVETAPVGPALMVVFEELNATLGLLKESDRRLPKGCYSAMDAFRDLVFMGRAPKIHIVATAQLASYKATSGPDILENFSTRILLRYSEQAWRWLVGGTYQPAPQESGRGMVCQGQRARECQFLNVSEPEAQALVLHSPHARALAESLTPRFTRIPSQWRTAASRTL